MDAKYTPKTDQRAGIRPISFVLDNLGSLSDPVMLPIRPEDLTRTEPTRATVHQTLGREVSGWVDHFGLALPSVTIAGTTGWRYLEALGRDGYQSFEALNEMVVHRLSEFKQKAIDIGRDPADVKLLFVDLLDDFTWSVMPSNFVLRRSKQRPLLLQYNITMQAVSILIDNPISSRPTFGTVSGGLGALGSLISRMKSIAAAVQGLVAKVLGFVDGLLGPIVGAVKAFVDFSAGVLGAVNDVVKSAKDLASGVANRLIGIAGDIAKVGTNVFRTLGAIAGLPASLKAAVGGVAAAFNEMGCILANSLRPSAAYEEYSGLYGASNCSSTTGGRGASDYAGSNAFNAMQPAAPVVMLTSAAQSSMGSLSRMDPVLAPMPLPEMGRHLDVVVRGGAL